MKFGIMFPAPEMGANASQVRDFAQGAERSGYDQIQIHGQTIGVDPAGPAGRRGPYTHETAFLDPFVAMGFMAAVTERIRFMPSVMVLPSRSAVLVAKQAADADVLSGGRVGLGVGVGNNEVDFDALGVPFKSRGPRMEEQVKVMRSLWTQPSVTFFGHWHHLAGIGISPPPVQRPIPIWMGGEAPAAIARIGRLADGYIRGGATPPDQVEQRINDVKEAVKKAGRDLAGFEIGEALMVMPGSEPAQWRAAVERAAAMGATYVFVGTLRRGFTSASQHLELAAEVLAAVKDVA